jgi:T5SS/PEP-CTERM-associated repeat protein
MSTPIAAPAQSRWRAISRANWFTAADWTAGVPNPGVQAVFGGGQTVVVRLVPPRGATPAAADALLVQGDSLTLAGGTLALGAATIEARIDHAGTLTIARTAALTGPASVVVGGATSGRLVVYGTLTDSAATVGGAVAASVLVSGAGADWSNSLGYDNLFLGGAATVLLSIADGGRVDGGPAALTSDARIDIGDGEGDATVLVRGAGSALTEALVALGNGDAGTLDILAGATVTDDNGLDGTGVNGNGNGGDGKAMVSGAGSQWTNLNLLEIGGQVPVVSSLTIADHGAVSFGAYGLTLFGTLAIDPTATLTGESCLSGGGVIEAIAGPGGSGGVVTISTDLDLFNNLYDPLQTMTTYVGSAPGTTLDLSGTISDSGTLSVGSGHVALINPANTYAATALRGGVLEVAASGATGTGPLQFFATDATLLLDAGVEIANVIGGFGRHSTIDLAGIGAGRSARLHWTATPGGGTLAVSDGTHTVDLAFSGSYRALPFQPGDDGHGGTLITFVPHP